MPSSASRPASRRRSRRTSTRIVADEPRALPPGAPAAAGARPSCPPARSCSTSAPSPRSPPGIATGRSACPSRARASRRGPASPSTPPSRCGGCRDGGRGRAARSPGSALGRLLRHARLHPRRRRGDARHRSPSPSSPRLVDRGAVTVVDVRGAARARRGSHPRQPQHPLPPPPEARRPASERPRRDDLRDRGRGQRSAPPCSPPGASTRGPSRPAACATGAPPAIRRRARGSRRSPTREATARAQPLDTETRVDGAPTTISTACSSLRVSSVSSASVSVTPIDLPSRWWLTERMLPRCSATTPRMRESWPGPVGDHDRDHEVPAARRQPVPHDRDQRRRIDVAAGEHGRGEAPSEPDAAREERGDRAPRPAPSTTSFARSSEQHDRARDLLVVDDDDVVEQLAQDRLGQRSRVLDGDAVGDRRARVGVSPA